MGRQIGGKMEAFRNMSVGNPLQALQDLVPHLQQILEAGEAIHELGTQLNPLLEEVTDIRDVVGLLIQRSEDLEVETTCQRWVSLKLLQASMTWTHTPDTSGLLVIEEQLRGEFFGVYGLVRCMETLKETRGS